MDLLILLLAQAEPADPAGGGASVAQQTTQWVLMAGGMAIIIWVMLRLQWKRQRRAAEEDGPVEAMRSTLIERQAEAERAAEVGELVRDLAARLETRAARLEALLDQADERIERLEARLAASTAHKGLGTDAPAPAAARNGHQHDPEADPWADPGQPARAQPGLPDDPLHQEVYELADAGQTPLAIARRLDQQVGTIELILALRR